MNIQFRLFVKPELIEILISSYKFNTFKTILLFQSISITDNVNSRHPIENQIILIMKKISKLLKLVHYFA